MAGADEISNSIVENETKKVAPVNGTTDSHVATELTNSSDAVSKDFEMVAALSEVPSKEGEANSEKPEAEQEPVLSKNQRKKLKRNEEFEATKQERRRLQREKSKMKRKLKVEAGVELGPSRKALKGVTMAGSACKQRLVVDMSFGSLMSEKDMCKTIKQVHRCYSFNRRVESPLQFHLTSLNGASLNNMERNVGFRNWDVNISDESYSDIFPASDIVYLTSDSENVVDVLDESKVYIIGGLVDHNNQKGLCHKLAVEKKIGHAKLPIGKFLDMKTRQVLTIDQVFQIILYVASEKKSWEDAFMTTIPSRKGASLKKPETTEDADDVKLDELSTNNAPVSSKIPQTN